MSQAKNVTLYCSEGGSDKVYQASLQARDGGWVVDFAYGPRGKALKSGTKTAAPLGYEAAARIYDKLVKEKTAKGYTECESGVAYVGTDREQQASGMHPELPTAIEPGDVTAYLADDAFVMQEKHDGENRQVHVSAGHPSNVVRGINRKSLYVPVRADWDAALRQLPACLIAGEDMGDHLVAFDLLELDGVDLRPQPFEQRHKALTELVAAFMPTVIKASPVYAGADKRRRLEEVRAANGEGVVFKRAQAGHTAGYSENQFKLKFKESATCIVLRHNAQRSVAVGLMDGAGNLIDLGNVTVPANAQLPGVDSLIEVQYLYRFDGGCFEQPVFKGPRTDVDRNNAVLSQVKRIKPRVSAGLGAGA